jgi:hypothetical protein
MFWETKMLKGKAFSISVRVCLFQCAMAAKIVLIILHLRANIYDWFPPPMAEPLISC